MTEWYCRACGDECKETCKDRPEYCKAEEKYFPVWKSKREMALFKHEPVHFDPLLERDCNDAQHLPELNRRTLPPAVIKLTEQNKSIALETFINYLPNGELPNRSESTIKSIWTYEHIHKLLFGGMDMCKLIAVRGIGNSSEFSGYKFTMRIEIIIDKDK
jgi:hypothetical protein